MYVKNYILIHHIELKLHFNEFYGLGHGQYNDRISSNKKNPIKYLKSNIQKRTVLCYSSKRKKLLSDKLIKDAFIVHVLDQHATLVLHSTSTLTRKLAGTNVAPLGHILQIPSKADFALTP